MSLHSLSDVLTVADAAAILGISGARVRVLAGAGDGRLRGDNSTGRWLFLRRDVLAFKRLSRPNGKRLSQPRRSKSR